MSLLVVSPWWVGCTHSYPIIWISHVFYLFYSHINGIITYDVFSQKKQITFIEYNIHPICYTYIYITHTHIYIYVYIFIAYPITYAIHPVTALGDEHCTASSKKCHGVGDFMGDFTGELWNHWGISPSNNWKINSDNMVTIWWQYSDNMVITFW